MSRQGDPSGAAGLRLLLLLAVVIGAGGMAIALVYQLVGGQIPPAPPVAYAASPQLAEQSPVEVPAPSDPAAPQAGPADSPDEATAAAPEEAAPARGEESSCPSDGVQFITHIVQRGDTLFLLARRHGTTVQAIKAANGLKCDTIIIGQKLLIPISVVCPRPVVTVCPTPVPAVVSCPQPVVVCPPPVVVVVCPPQPVCLPVCPVVCVPACPQVCVPVADP